MDHEIYLISSMNLKDVESLKLNHRANIQSTLDEVLNGLQKDTKIAVLPYATHTMPKIRE
jgi:hypothetical protein